MFTPTKNHVGVSGVAAIMGWKSQYARDRMLEGKFGTAEQDARGRWWVLRSKVTEFKRRQSEPPKPKAEG